MKFYLEDSEEVDYVKLLEDRGRDDEEIPENTTARQVERILKLDELDLASLKNCLLFQNWDPSLFANFVQENNIVLKQFKYKEVVAIESECDDQIFLIKHGEAGIWTKMRRHDMQEHQRILEKLSANSKFLNSKIDKQRSKYVRDSSLIGGADGHLIKSKINVQKSDVVAKSTKLIGSKLIVNEQVHESRSVRFDMTRKASRHAALASILTAPPKEPKPILKKTIERRPLIRLKSASTETMIRRQSGRQRSKSFSSFTRTSLVAFTPLDPLLTSDTKRSTSLTNIHYSMKRVKRDSLDHRKEIQTKYPEIWKELMNARRSWCFVKVMKLHPDHLFGLSDYLYNIKREQEQMFTDNTRLGESSSLEMDPLDDEDPGGELAEPAPSVFYMICTSYRLECYCINKVAYFKHMLAFATDKTIINHYLDQLREKVDKLPSSQQIREQFFQQMAWDYYRKRFYQKEVSRVCVVRVQPVRSIEPVRPPVIAKRHTCKRKPRPFLPVLVKK